MDMSSDDWEPEVEKVMQRKSAWQAFRSSASINAYPGDTYLIARIYRYFLQNKKYSSDN
jgi:hypothetical protein